ncbi:Protein of unknwon function (DUF2893) [Serratia fonticola]|uniref:Protein of unknwon function (DUF2893) n=1 Tax=Serratia fonticola TaxID=47917 RepID=A0A3S5F1C0_SERFO|nr:Protein of unknwon function (DUF2893) [Serratia fonticola]
MEIEHKSFSVKVSGPARAIMECLYLAPKSQPLMEVYELMESLNNLRPATVQKLLESCSSVKVKRLFLYLADKAGHEWLSYINIQNIDLGTGKRSIVEGGSISRVQDNRAKGTGSCSMKRLIKNRFNYYWMCCQK